MTHERPMVLEDPAADKLIFARVDTPYAILE